MDRQGFRTFLQSYELKEEQVKVSIAIADRFMTYVHEAGRTPSADTAWAFSQLLIEEGNNTEDNYITLIHYCRFIKNNEMFVALLELVDGGEVDENLYRMAGEKFGIGIRDEVLNRTLQAELPSHQEYVQKGKP